MGSSEASTRRRVKLYILNEDRQWDDKGTGHVSALYTEQDNMALVVISETDGSYLLESKIQPDTAYQKQQETLIVWSEGENMDLALSFQEKIGCDDVWEKICAVQGKDPSVEITQEVIDESDDVDDTDAYTPTLIQSIQPLDLPACELSRLEETVDLISQAVTSPPKRERLVVLLESTNYINQLIDVFHKAEDLEDLESLHHLYEIMRQLILLNKQSLYEILFAEDMLMDVIGILEYNPSGCTKHRDFLKKKATFKEVLPLHNSDLVAKIHQTYRVQYIQDCCLPPPCLFDEHTLSQLKSFISINKMDIIRSFQEDEEFMRLLFARLKAPDTDLAHRRDLSLFVKEFCNISIQTDQKESFLSCLLQHGALRTSEVLLSIDDRDIRSAALEILQAFIEHQPSVVREFVYRETAPFRKDDELLINLMINQLLSDNDPELSDAFLLGYMLRILIDPDNMNNPGVRGEKTEFLSFFYKRCINTLVRPLFENTAKDVLEKDDYHSALVLNHILELLTFCIETHTYHIRNYCFNRDLLKRVLVLLQSSHKFLVLAALRLLRRVVHMKEEIYNRYLIKSNLFKPVLKLFVANGHRYNLVDSAIIELFDYIRSEEITSLITHIIENFWDILKNINYVKTFVELKKFYDHSHRAVRPTMTGSVGQLDVLSLVNVAESRFQPDSDLKEEQWFDEDDDEEDDESEHLFPTQTPALLNGTVVGTTALSSDVASNLPNVHSYGTHSVVTTPTDLLGIGTSTIAQSNFSSLSSPGLPNLDPCASVLPHSTNLSSNLDSLTDSNCALLRPNSLPDKFRLRQHSTLSDEEQDTLSPRLNVARHSPPITIHIKSSAPNRLLIDKLSESDEVDLPSEASSDPTFSRSPSINMDTKENIETNLESSFMETSFQTSNNVFTKHLSSFIPMFEPSQQQQSRKIICEMDIGSSHVTHDSSPPKRMKKSSPQIHKQTSNTALSLTDVSSSTQASGSLTMADSSTCDSNASQTSSIEFDKKTDVDMLKSSPIGLVDYSDEESEDEQQSNDTEPDQSRNDQMRAVGGDCTNENSEVSSSQSMIEHV